MQNSAYTNPINLELWRNWRALYFYWRLEKRFEVIENIKKLELEEDWVELGPKVSLLRQSQAKYMEQDGEIQ